MLIVAGCLSVIASRLSVLCLSNHGLAPVASNFHAFGTVWPGCDGAGHASRKSFTALAVGWEEQQASAPLASPTICCKTRKWQVLKMVGDKLAKARFYPPYNSSRSGRRQTFDSATINQSQRNSGEFRYGMQFNRRRRVGRAASFSAARVSHHLLQNT